MDFPVLSQQIQEQLSSWPNYQKARHVLTYLAFGHEFSLDALHEDLGKTFYITRTHFKPEPYLSIHKLSQDLEKHPFGYWQPSKSAPRIAPEQLDLVLVPGLVFDKTGSRLGYGMGFYDRLLRLIPQHVAKVAITLETFIVPQLPQESFDIKMTHFATETGILLAEP